MVFNVFFCCFFMSVFCCFLKMLFRCFWRSPTKYGHEAMGQKEKAQQKTHVSSLKLFIPFASRIFVVCSSGYPL